MQDVTLEELVNGWGRGQATDGGSGFQDQQCLEGYLPLYPGKQGRVLRRGRPRQVEGGGSYRESRKANARCHMLVGTSLGRGEAVPA